MFKSTHCANVSFFSFSRKVKHSQTRLSPRCLLWWFGGQNDKKSTHDGKLHTEKNDQINTFRRCQFFSFFQKSQKSTFAQDELLIQILHFPYIEISVLDIGRIARYLSKYEVKKTTLEFLNDLEILTEIQVSNTDLCVQIQEKFIYLIQNYFVLTPQVFLEKLFHDFGILKFVINSPDKYFLLNVLNRFYEYIKNQSSKNQEYTMDKLLVEIQHMLNNNIAMPIYNAIGTKHGVQLSTIYKSCLLYTSDAADE